MKISSIKLKESKDSLGLQPFYIRALGRVVVVSGSNGSGKTRLLKLLQQYVHSLQSGEDSRLFSLQICSQGRETPLTVDNVDELELANYSHYDAQLQLPKRFTPYVICKAKELLRVCNYEETALNSLLLLQDMAMGYSEEFQDGTAFQDFMERFAGPFQLEIEINPETKELRFFGQDMEKAGLSPGQQYLLRIAVACYQNLDNEKMIFLLDEPELHLHPRAQIELLNHLREKFPKAQFWIATHSLALISYLTVAEKDTTVLHLSNGEVKLLRSDSSKLLEGLIGAEENRFAIRQLLAMPDEYACNRFAVECTSPPDTLGASGNDPQTELVQTILHKDDIVVDFGAGKGRFFEELAAPGKGNIAREIQYFAYDPSPKDAECCKAVMECNGSNAANYFNEIQPLLGKVGGQVDYVLLVNVLHEIDPVDWPDIFKLVQQLLKEEGQLIIVEREELTIGEAPYDNGFLMLMENGAVELFGEKGASPKRHPEKPYIIKYEIPKSRLAITEMKVIQCIEEIQKSALEKIDLLKHGSEKKDDHSRYQAGIKLAFYLHQYANAALCLSKLK